MTSSNRKSRYTTHHPVHVRMGECSNAVSKRRWRPGDDQTSHYLHWPDNYIGALNAKELGRGNNETPFDASCFRLIYLYNASLNSLGVRAFRACEMYRGFHRRLSCHTWQINRRKITRWKSEIMFRSWIKKWIYLQKFNVCI